MMSQTPCLRLILSLIRPSHYFPYHFNRRYIDLRELSPSLQRNHLLPQSKKHCSNPYILLTPLSNSLSLSSHLLAYPITLSETTMSPLAKAASQNAPNIKSSILSLYRSLLRTSLRKDDGFKSYEHVRLTFRRDAGSVKRMEFNRIEFLVRQGRKQLKVLEMVEGVGSGGGGGGK